MDNMFRNVNFICDTNGIEVIPVEVASTIDGMVLKAISFRVVFGKDFEETSKRIENYKQELTDAIIEHAIDNRLFVRDCSEVNSGKNIWAFIEVFVNE
jgi:hypothetical protein